MSARRQESEDRDQTKRRLGGGASSAGSHLRWLAMNDHPRSMRGRCPSQGALRLTSVN